MTAINQDSGRSAMTVDEIVNYLSLDQKEAALLRNCVDHYGNGYAVVNGYRRSVNGFYSLIGKSEWQQAKKVLTEKIARIFSQRIEKDDAKWPQRSSYIVELADVEAEILLRIQTQMLLLQNRHGTLFLPIDPSKWNTGGWFSRHIDTDIDYLVDQANTALRNQKA